MRTAGELRDLVQRLEKAAGRLRRPGPVALFTLGAREALLFVLCEDCLLERVVAALEQAQPAGSGREGAPE